MRIVAAGIALCLVAAACGCGKRPESASPALQAITDGFIPWLEEAAGAKPSAHGCAHSDFQPRKRTGFLVHCRTALLAPLDDRHDPVAIGRELERRTVAAITAAGRLSGGHETGSDGSFRTQFITDRTIGGVSLVILGTAREPVFLLDGWEVDDE